MLRRSTTLRLLAKAVMKDRTVVTQDEGLYRSHALSAAALLLLTPYKSTISREPSVMAATQICSPVV